VKEVWATIPEFPYYEASSRGRVRAKRRYVRFLSKAGRECFRLKDFRIVSQQFQNGGYKVVHLHHNDVRTCRTVHSLVLQAFVGPRPRGFDICHKNHKRDDNCLINLEYGSRAYNRNKYIKRRVTEKEVRAIRRLRNRTSAKVVAQTYGFTSENPVRRIWAGKSWSWVK